MIAFFIPSVFCAEGNNLRNQQRVNLAPGAGGYGSNDMEDNYDYILDDTPPRGTNFGCTINARYLFVLISNKRYEINSFHYITSFL